MSSFVTAGVQVNKAVKFLEVTSGGLHFLDIINLGGSDVVMSLLKRSNKKVLVDASGLTTKVSSESGRNGGSLANTPVCPGSVEVKATSINSLKDKNLDGVLYWDRTPNAVLISGADGATSGATLTSAGSDFATAGVVAGDTLVLKNGADADKYTVLTVGTTTLVVTTPFPTGSESSLNFSVIANDLPAGTINYFTGLLNLSYPSSPAAASPANKGTVLGTVSFPINLEPGDTVVVDIDGGGNATATFDAAASTLAGSAGSFATMASETMEVAVQENGVYGEWQLITFGTEGTQQAAVDLINAQLSGADAVINGANVDLVTEAKGTGARIKTQNVAAGITTKLGIQDATEATAGTGDVADINAVTFAEAKAVIEADVSDSLCELDGGKLRITSNSSNEGASSSVQVDASSTADTAFGLDNTAHAGDDADAKQPITVDYAYSTAIQDGKMSQCRIIGRDNDIVEVYFAAKDDAAKVRLEAKPYAK
jgi:hypothetical protein